MQGTHVKSYYDRGYPTPWGPAQDRWEYKEGINFYSTAGHGGMKVNKPINQLIPEQFRAEDGWYEEDVDAVIVLHFLLGEDYSSKLKDYYPDEWESLTGEVVTAAESYRVAEREFQDTHKNDWVVVSARGDWATDVPEGMVGATAVLGGNRGTYGNPVEKREFLVPKEEYDQRSRFGFVIDTERHETKVNS